MMQPAKRSQTFRWLSVVLLAAATLGLVVGLTADASERSAAPTRRVSPQQAMECLATEFLEALGDSDAKGLKDLALSREEWDRRIWNHLPASDPKTNLTSDFVWGQMAMRSRSALAGVLSRYGGRRLRLKELAFSREPERYGPVCFHRGVLLKVEDPSNGVLELNAFATIVEYEGVYQILCYRRDR